MENKKIIGFLIGLVLVLICGCIYLWQVVPERGKSFTNEGIESNQQSQNEFVNTNKTGTNDSDSKSKEESSDVYIYICGQIKKPGVYKFRAQPRLIEVVKKAGGFKKNADKKALNLAQSIPDGTQIEIIKKGSKKNKKTNDSKVSNSSVGNQSSSEGKININTASKEELTKISGIGDARASQIISYRENKGLFKNIEDIKNISGIKDGIYAKIKDMICI